MRMTPQLLHHSLSNEPSECYLDSNTGVIHSCRAGASPQSLHGQGGSTAVCRCLRLREIFLLRLDARQVEKERTNGRLLLTPTTTTLPQDQHLDSSSTLQACCSTGSPSFGSCLPGGLCARCNPVPPGQPREYAIPSNSKVSPSIHSNRRLPNGSTEKLATPSFDGMVKETLEVGRDDLPTWKTRSLSRSGGTTT